MLWRTLSSPEICDLCLALRCGRMFYSNKFITVPAFYANADPHLGHLYSATLGDVSRRWELLKNDENRVKNMAEKIAGKPSIFLWDWMSMEARFRVIYPCIQKILILKIEAAARLAGMEPQQHCDVYYKNFEKMFKTFNISYTHFVRTSQESHKTAVNHFWRKLQSTGSIYKDNYEGWYSTVDECFYGDKEVDCVTDEATGTQQHVAIETKSSVTFVKEQNYMFDYKKLSSKIRNWLINDDVIHPKHYLPIALHQLAQQEQRDFKLSISRDSSRMGWGIPVPDDPSQNIYVWLDALVSYLTAAGYLTKENFCWPPDLQIIGKDILKFHAIYWPAFLLDTDLPLPKKLYVHSHWLVNKAKMSKSTGNVIDPFEAATTLTPDGLRYFLVRHGLPFEDINFTFLRAINAVNSDLVNNLGNLLHRACHSKLNPRQKYPGFDLEVMEHELKGAGEGLVLELKTLRERVGNHYNNLLFFRGLETINETVKKANAFSTYRLLGI